jgi:hypothetical protein
MAIAMVLANGVTRQVHSTPQPTLCNQEVRMSNEINANIKELPRFRTCQLRSLWLQLFAKPPQLKLQRDVPAYQIQEDPVLHGFGGQRGLLSFGGSS